MKNTIYLNIFLGFLNVTVHSHVYLFNTEDSSDVEYFDCVYVNVDSKVKYCVRPDVSVSLNREAFGQVCQNNGQLWFFSDLLKNNISASTVLKWSSSIDEADQYAAYIARNSLEQTVGDDSICNCTQLSTFGKYCEYQFPNGKSEFRDELYEQYISKEKYPLGHQLHGDILCYTTLDLYCDYGLLCLDWRNICDGAQQCTDGTDEENCDLLEFNECDPNEYRCDNGMCIDDIYFLDGEYDCADWSDEMNKADSDGCSHMPLAFNCDEHQCRRFHWSCGDGQCFSPTSRMGFQEFISKKKSCVSMRELAYACETTIGMQLWTLPNGLCWPFPGYDDKTQPSPNASDADLCSNFCGKGELPRNYSSAAPQYDRNCWSNEHTFNNQPYAFIDVCQSSHECISTYRIRDGSLDCYDMLDEEDVTLQNTCQNILKYRFRCSIDENKCLSVDKIGDFNSDCKNKADENNWQMGILSRRDLCNHRDDTECQQIRMLLIESWHSNKTNIPLNSLAMFDNRLPFKYICDSFWSSTLYDDESPFFCRLWTCPLNQYQCLSGQCIDPEWICDGQFDCSDGTDEQAIFLVNSSTKIDSTVINLTEAKIRCADRYRVQPFSSFCNLTEHYPCLLANVPDPTDVWTYTPCINLSQIGDGNVDCFGGWDERNILTGCRFDRMMGFDFHCNTITYATNGGMDDCRHHSQLCNTRCPLLERDNPVCFYQSQKNLSNNNCDYPTDFRCLNGTCLNGNVHCDGKPQCAYGEDEYRCPNKSFFEASDYRSIKHEKIFRENILIDLPEFPSIIHCSIQFTFEMATSLSNTSNIIRVPSQ
ncbi:unnamed protein product [Adineta steineri]|uniref:Uncharacterized protein n=1 Tax=Adineta steineri TaxID=433720 RepID=A0A814L1H9_9BILA|nr:unnamed protein product [Adineta steineri]CAF3768961.1 unnamed protein product [Adineta steineri]